MKSRSWAKRRAPVVIWAILTLAGAAMAGAAEQEEEAMAAPLTPLVVEEAVICKGIENRAPVEPGETFEDSVGRLYCFTRITGAYRETLIHHIWYPPDRNLHEQALPVKSPSWRTWSYKTIPTGWTGVWRVEVTTEDGVVLKTIVFEVK